MNFFEAPSMLWFLPAAALPVVFHLVSRKMVPRVDFPAVMLLRRAAVTRKGRLRLRRMVLMLLRILLIAVLITASARPFVTVAGTGTGPGMPVSLVIVLDDSLSMKRMINGRSLFDMAVARAERELSGLAPTDSAALVLAGRPLRTPVSELSFDLKKIRKAVRSAEASFRKTDLAGALESAGLILERSAPSGRRVLLLSDQGAHAWKKPAVPWDAKDNIELLLPGIPLHADWNNHAVDSVTVSESHDLGPLGIAIEAGIVNSAHGSSEELMCRLEIGGKTVAQTAADVPAHGRVTVVFQHAFEKPGIYEGSVHLPDDSLAGDNVMHFLVSVGRSLNVLVINGDPRPGSYHDEAFYLRRALATSRKIKSAVVDQFKAAQMSFDDYDVVFLINAGSFSEALRQSVESFLKRGGGIFISTGENTSPEDPWQDILPADIRGPVESSVASLSPGLNIAKTAGGFLSEMKQGRTGFEDVAVRKRFVPLAGGTGDFRTLMTYRDGIPALIESESGGGTVMLWTSTIDRDWTDLPIRPGFVPLVQESAGRLAGRRALISHRRITARSPIDIYYPAVAGSLTVHAPGGIRRTFARSDLADSRKINFADTSVPGVYRIRIERMTDGALMELVEEAFVVRHPEDEWDLKPNPVAGTDAGSSSSLSGITTGRIPLWPYLLLLFVLLLIAESFAAGAYLYKKKMASM